MILANKLLILISFLLLILCIFASFERSGLIRRQTFFHLLLKPHALYGVLLLITSFSHGILSGSHPAMISGKTAWLCLFLLLLFSLFRRRMKEETWLKFHRTFTVIFCLLLLFHIVHAILS